MEQVTELTKVILHLTNLKDEEMLHRNQPVLRKLLLQRVLQTEGQRHQVKLLLKI